MVRNRVVALIIQLEGDTSVVFVVVGSRSEGDAQMWGSGKANVIHEFGKVGDRAEAQRVVSAESHVSLSNGFPVQWAVLITKSLTGGDEQIVSYDEGLGTDDVQVILGLPEGSGGIIFGRIDFLVRKGKVEIVNADKVCLSGTGEGNDWFLVQVN